MTSRFCFYQEDIALACPTHLGQFGVDVVIHFAAQSHVDNSIGKPKDCILNNILATQNMLDFARANNCKFINFSTDEVFGSLRADDPSFTVNSQYRPNSPYSASKAACDHIVRSYIHTYGLNAMTINSSNNFGPYQHQEKFIPKTIWSLMRKQPIAIYGDGTNIRDWMHVDDTCSFLCSVLNSKFVGGQHLIGANDQWSNADLVNALIDEYERLTGYRGLRSLISFVKDRPGHDFRYHVDNSAAAAQFYWSPKHSIKSSLYSTVKWYLDHPEWFNVG